MSINIDHIYCINLDECQDRWKYMQEQFDRLDLKVERFPGRKGYQSDYNPHNKKKGQLGCLKSHLDIIKNAKKNNYKQILIFEDDVTICDDFHERLKKFSKHIPKNWKEAYLGGTIIHKKPEKVNNFVYKNKRTNGAFSIIIKKEIYDILINEYSKFKLNADDVHADVIQKHHPSYIFFPFFTHINKGYSNTTNNQVSDRIYNLIHKHYKNKI